MLQQQAAETTRSWATLCTEVPRAGPSLLGVGQRAWRAHPAFRAQPPISQHSEGAGDVVLSPKQPATIQLGVGGDLTHLASRWDGPALLVGGPRRVPEADTESQSGDQPRVLAAPGG